MILSQRVLLTDGFVLLGLCAISLLGDCLCFGRPSSFVVVKNKYLRALTDNLTHAMISVLATGFVFNWTRPVVLAVAFLAGSLVDLDHFIAIRSLSVNRVLTEPTLGRPCFHNSLHLMIVTCIAFGLEHFLCRPQSSVYYSMVFFLGWFTHHLRDGQRHGLTLSPVGQTPPIDYYIALMCLLLVAIKYSRMCFSRTRSAEVVSFSVV